MRRCRAHLPKWQDAWESEVKGRCEENMTWSDRREATDRKYALFRDPTGSTRRKSRDESPRFSHPFPPESRETGPMNRATDKRRQTRVNPLNWTTAPGSSQLTAIRDKNKHSAQLTERQVQRGSTNTRRSSRLSFSRADVLSRARKTRICRRLACDARPHACSVSRELCNYCRTACK